MATRPITADDLLRMQFLGDAQISPDGNTLLFAKKHITDKNKYLTHLYSLDLGAKNAASSLKQWTQGEFSSGMARWSPDGQTIAFISGREKTTAQIFLISTHGGEAKKLTDFPEGSIGGLSWSPDGRSLAVTFRETDSDRTQSAKSDREKNGQSDPPWVIESLFYRMDGDGWFGQQRFKIYIVDVETGKHSMLYDADPLGSYSFDWLRDSSGLIVAHSAAKDPLLDKPNQQLFKVPLKGKPKQIKCTTKGSKGSPKVSPNGEWIAYIGSDRPEDPWGVHNERLWVIGIEGGDPTCLTEHDDYCLDTMTLGDTLFGFVADGGGSGLVYWSKDSSKIYVNVGHEGAVDVAEVDRKKGGIKFLTQGKHIVLGSNVSKNGKTMAILLGSATALVEVGTLELSGKAKPKALTTFNKDFVDEVTLVSPEVFRVNSTDGAKVQAWVLRPPQMKGKKCPAILEIHGGPHAQYGYSVFHEFQVLCAQGYAVVYSNPRGSKGYGEEFCGAIRGDWGNKDWDDVRAVTDWMKKQDWIDGRKLGVMGGSYGGYMTNWVVSHTQDFKAAITDRCVFNWLSMAGNSDFPLNKDGYFGGQAWGPIDKIGKLWQQSPISHFESVKTPMLIIHSEGDLRCHVEQSEQVFFVMKSLGIEARYVRYPVSTSHGMSRNGPPDLRLHRLNEITSWWKKHLG